MKYAGIINNDVVNGKDVCVSYWCQGCRFRCPGCHNPQTWDFNSGIDAEEEEIIQTVIEAISKNGLQRNLSILGGEPLCDENMTFTVQLIENIKNMYPTIQVFLWTGYCWEDLLAESTKHPEIMRILKHTNLLVDGRFDIFHRDITLPFRGSSNQRVINVQASLKRHEVVLYKPTEEN